MARYTGPKCRQCRRAGEKLFLKGERCESAKCAVTKKNYPPGSHGSARRRRSSEYGLQLQEKQKAKRIYGVLENQFRNYFLKSEKKKGNTGEELLKALESRFDNVIYQAGFATSRNKARQMALHNHFKINGKKVNIPSYAVKEKDIISVSPAGEKSKSLANISERLKRHTPPAWINVDGAKKEIHVLKLPERDQIDTNINEHLIVEFYSR